MLELAHGPLRDRWRPPNYHADVAALLPGLATHGLIDTSNRYELQDAVVRNKRRYESSDAIEGEPLLANSGPVSARLENALRFLVDEKPGFFSRLQGRFRGITLVDLGAGDSWHGHTVASMLGCAGYVAAEPYHAVNLNENLRDNSDHLERRHREGKAPMPVPWAVIPEDMRTLLNRVTPNTISVMATGIDHYILSPQYAAEVVSQMSRTIHNDGAGIFLGSAILGWSLADSGEFWEHQATPTDPEDPFSVASYLVMRLP
ncbi:MAG: hypothetical protein JO026_03245 [Patescibacteria group bacterium]|nr:hypothetical protein [Patescibacteria group bacterium]